MDNNKIYIVDSFTNTVPGRIIKGRAALKFWNRWDGDTYSHTSLSRDIKLGNMMSLARREINNPFNCGFIKEDIREGIFGLNKDKSRIAVMELPVTKAQYDSISEQMDYYWEHKDEYQYNFLGIISMLIITRGLSFENKFFCSEWVATVLEEAGVNIFSDYKNKKPKDIAPFLFYKVLEDNIIYEGPVVEYPYYNEQRYESIADEGNSLIEDEQYILHKRGV